MACGQIENRRIRAKETRRKIVARRNLDGRYRNNNEAKTPPPSIVIARWTEGEVLALKVLGLTFAQIAARIIAISRGVQLPMTPLPAGIAFPENFRISPSGCHKSLNRALSREPRAGADLLSEILMHRTEDLFLLLQPMLRRGDPKAVMAAVRVLELQANIGLAKGKLSAQAATKPEPKSRPSPALPQLFNAAFKTLFDLGAVDFPGYVITPVEREPKMIETTFKDDNEAKEQSALQEERKDRDDKSK
jgi:hypothetical protein